MKKNHIAAVVAKVRQKQSVKNQPIAMNVVRVPKQETAFAAPVEAD